MGTPGATNNESPVEVELTPFLMQQFPVTREQYALYDPQHDSKHQKDMGSYAPERTCPVIDVSWWDAFCFALYTDKSLPTEAQWECACRAGTTTRFAFGRWGEPEQTNFGGNVGMTTPQRNYPPNRWGLYDMHGNVWEWCQDWYHAKLPGGRNPVVTERATDRVSRGGSWNGPEGDCRSAYRHRDWPGPRRSLLGFRVALVPG
jgi:formylglycine-generating enzyme required for sulfatase activity